MPTTGSRRTCCGQGIFLLLILVLSFLTPRAQDADNLTYKYKRFSFDDDIFKIPNRTDRYYTTGIKWEWNYANYKPAWIERIFLKPGKYNNKTISAGIGSNMYTPKIITNPAVDSTDRPFSGWLYLSTKGAYNVNSGKKMRLTTEYSIGVLGPLAYQKNVQTAFHVFIDDLIPSNTPKGWDNQIGNAIAVNANVKYETSLLKSKSPIFELIPLGELNIGSVMNYLRAGVNIRLGNKKSYFDNDYDLLTINPTKDAVATEPGKTALKGELKKKPFVSISGFARPTITAIAYNGMMQGGLIPLKKSKYVLKSDQISPLYLQLDYGVSFNFRKFALIITQNVRSKEFDNASSTTWGGISLIYDIRYFD